MNFKRNRAALRCSSRQRSAPPTHLKGEGGNRVKYSAATARTHPAAQRRRRGGSSCSGCYGDTRPPSPWERGCRRGGCMCTCVCMSEAGCLKGSSIDMAVFKLKSKKKDLCMPLPTLRSLVRTHLNQLRLLLGWIMSPPPACGVGGRPTAAAPDARAASSPQNKAVVLIPLRECCWEICMGCVETRCVWGGACSQEGGCVGCWAASLRLNWERKQPTATI